MSYGLRTVHRPGCCRLVQRLRPGGNVIPDGRVPAIRNVGERRQQRPHLRIEGPLKVDALNRALSRIVDRHSILRSTFPIVDGEPMQVVGEPLGCDLAMNDLTDLSDPAAAAAERCRAHGETVFDLTMQAPFAPILFRLAEDDHVLSIAMHHIVFDGWSEPRFLDELAIIYDTQLGSEPEGLARLAIQVRDFAAWQADRIDDLRESSDLEWWTEKPRPWIGELAP